MMYVFRNTAVEYLFDNSYSFSEYGSFAIPQDLANYDGIVFFNMLPLEFDRQILIDWIMYYQDMVKTISTKLSDQKVYVVTLHNYFYTELVRNNNKLEMAIDGFNRAAYSYGCNVIDIGEFWEKNCESNLIDMRFLYTYNAIINPKHAKAFRLWFEQEIQITKRVAKKCLVLDLDNTLWGGVLGENDIADLKISGSYPGNCYQDFQKLILQVKRSGVVLCISSKNNYDDVVECFSKRDDLVLKLDDFTLVKINWASKDKEIFAMAKKLNIGLDSIVFIDDSPQERMLVKGSLPDVEVLDFPDSPCMLLAYFSKEFRRLFSIDTISNEDGEKTELYKNMLAAQERQAYFVSQEDFIKDLEIDIEYQHGTDYNLERITQLINKTNQFNLTTKRYLLEEVRSKLKYGIITAIKVRDKFGDLGIVGCSIVVPIADNNCAIDVFLLSCRALGRNLEFDYINKLLHDLRSQGFKQVKAQYIGTAKNEQVKYFYEKCGFTLVENQDNIKYYTLNLQEEFLWKKE